MILKVITYGFILNGKNSYILNYWNILDFIIVIFSFIGIFFSSSEMKKIKILRVLR